MFAVITDILGFPVAIVKSTAFEARSGHRIRKVALKPNIEGIPGTVKVVSSQVVDAERTYSRVFVVQAAGIGIAYACLVSRKCYYSAVGSKIDTLAVR